MTAQYDRRRNYVPSRFEEMGIDCFRASGAFYAFPECPWDDADEFAEAFLQEEKVAVVPGTAFGAGGDGHLRVSYATGLDELKTAMNRLESFVS
jgi:aminotransferase